MATMIDATNIHADAQGRLYWTRDGRNYRTDTSWRGVWWENPLNRNWSQIVGACASPGPQVQRVIRAYEAGRTTSRRYMTIDDRMQAAHERKA